MGRWGSGAGLRPDGIFVEPPPTKFSRTRELRPQSGWIVLARACLLSGTGCPPCRAVDTRCRGDDALTCEFPDASKPTVTPTETRSWEAHIYLPVSSPGRTGTVTGRSILSFDGRPRRGRLRLLCGGRWRGFPAYEDENTPAVATRQGGVDLVVQRVSCHTGFSGVRDEYVATCHAALSSQ